MQGSVCGMLYLQQAIALKGTIQGEQAGSGSNGIGYDFLPSNLQTFKPSNLQTFKPSNLQTLGAVLT
ncbi:hypothetical protein FS592_11245 [Serratia plymuthica]|uniref:hypothetical protein n=1 Tax=Serratia plymuthica TaxID=82996 RepID=UPI001F2F6C1F|nr:hypothetical protein [Serratia plymuthica]UJD99120.1 hypothetical protein FS592_11245 [Serratia plymuthica]